MCDSGEFFRAEVDVCTTRQELWVCAAPVRRRNGNVRESSFTDSWLAAEHVNRQGAVRRLVGRTVPRVAASPL